MKKYCKTCGKKILSNACNVCVEKENRKLKYLYLFKKTLGVIGFALLVSFLFFGIVLIAASSSSKPNLMIPGVIGAFIIILVSWIPILRKEWKAENKKELLFDDKLVGISGWLFFPVLGMIISTLLSLYTISLFSGFFLFLQILFLLFQFIVLLYTFQKKKLAIHLVIAFLFVNLFINSLTGDASLAIKSSFSLIVWSLYFVKSKRVRLTFIN